MVNDCPVCGEGILTPVCVNNTIEYRGCSEAIPLRYKICDYCGSEIADSEDMKINKQASISFKRRIDLQIDKNFE